MAAHKHVIDAKSVEWCAKLSLVPLPSISLM